MINDIDMIAVEVYNKPTDSFHNTKPRANHVSFMYRENLRTNGHHEDWKHCRFERSPVAQHFRSSEHYFLKKDQGPVSLNFLHLQNSYA